VIQVESAFYPLAVSRKGAMGLMQLMPATARDMDVMDPWDPNENLRGGTTYLRHLLDLFGGQIDLALAGYNAGPDAVQRYGGIPPFDETRDYVERVLRIYRGEPDLVVESRHLSSRGRKTYLIRGADGSYTLTTDKTVNR
jgi:soluble lytic murein transglycosylase